MRYLPLLLLLACGTDPSQPSVTRTCLASITYRYAAADTFDTHGAVAPQGGPLCMEFTGDEVRITSDDALYLELYVASTGAPGIMYLGPAGTWAVADVFRKDGQVYFVAREGSLRWIGLPGMVIVEGAHGIWYMDWQDADETLHTEWRP